MKLAFSDITSIVAAGLFVVSLIFFISAKWGRIGNVLALLGSACAFTGALYLPYVYNRPRIFVAAVAGLIPALILALKIPRAALRSLIPLGNATGSFCALCVSMYAWENVDDVDNLIDSIPAVLGVVLGAFAFTGSLVAAGKSQGWLGQNSRRWPLQSFFNVFFFITMILFVRIAFIHCHCEIYRMWLAAGSAMLLGASLLLARSHESFSTLTPLLGALAGVSTAAAGFGNHNIALLTAGGLVAGAGLSLAFPRKTVSSVQSL